MKKWLFSGVVTSLLALPALSFAHIESFETYVQKRAPFVREYPNQGWFYSFHLGFNQMTEFDLKPEFPGRVVVNPDPMATVTRTYKYDEFNVSYKRGIILGGKAGYRRRNWRFEGEFSVRQDDIEDIINNFITEGTHTYDAQGMIVNTVTAVSQIPNVGDAGDALSMFVMMNVYYDFLFGNHWMPFVGFGVGMGQIQVEYDMQKVGGPRIKDTSLDFAYQAMVGIGYVCNRTVEVDVMLKYFSAGERNLEEKYVLGAQYFQSVRFNSEYDGISLEFEVRIF